MFTFNKSSVYVELPPSVFSSNDGHLPSASVRRQFSQCSLLSKSGTCSFSNSFHHSFSIAKTRRPQFVQPIPRPIQACDQCCSGFYFYDKHLRRTSPSKSDAISALKLPFLVVLNHHSNLIMYALMTVSQNTGLSAAPLTFCLDWDDELARYHKLHHRETGIFEAQ